MSKFGDKWDLRILRKRIMSDEVMWNILKRTWIGSMINCMVGLRKGLIEKQEKSDDILSSMISFESPN